MLVILLLGVRPPLKPTPVLFACLPASPLPSSFTIPRPLLCPPPKSPTIPPFASTARERTFQEGANCHSPWTACCVFSLCAHIWLRSCSRFVIISSSSAPVCHQLACSTPRMVATLPFLLSWKTNVNTGGIVLDAHLLIISVRDTYMKGMTSCFIQGRISAQLQCDSFQGIQDTCDLT